MNKVDLFYVGPPKTASTWVYTCLREHPELTTSTTDSIRFFDNLYHRGEDWYHRHFEAKPASKVTLDPTPSYISSPLAPERIAQYNPNAKIIVCLRNPIERAFSHWWHLRKKGIIGWRFEESLDNHNTYALFIESSMIAGRLEYFRQVFGTQQVHIVFFEDIHKQPALELQKLMNFAGIDPGFEPQALNRRVNAAGAKMTLFRRATNKFGRQVYGNRFEDQIRRSSFARWLSGREEYNAGIQDEFREELLLLYADEIARLEELTSTDLSRWKS